MKSAAMNNKGAISSDWKQISYQQQRRRGKKRSLVPGSEMKSQFFYSNSWTWTRRCR